jgi:hypothetical protein
VTTSAERGATTDGATSTAEAALTRLLLLARADLAPQLRTDDSAAVMVGRVLELVLRLVPGAEHAAVSLAGEPAECFAASDDVALACETAQLAAAVGPLFDIAAGAGAVRCDDLARDTRWPTFAAAAVDARTRSLLACELAMGRNLRGSLTVYAVEPNAFGEVGELVLPMFAARSGMALAYADKMDNLRRAIDTRQVIGQACGILMERHRITSEQAFADLVAVSQRHHLKLRELAVRVVESGQDPAEAALA